MGEAGARSLAMMPLSLALSALLAASALETAAASSLEAVQAREQVNFDFAWYVLVQRVPCLSLTLRPRRPAL